LGSLNTNFIGKLPLNPTNSWTSDHQTRKNKYGAWIKKKLPR
jgi:hypothetical protein